MSALVRDDITRLGHRAAQTFDPIERAVLLAEISIVVRDAHRRGLLSTSETIDLLADVALAEAAKVGAAVAQAVQP